MMPMSIQTPMLTKRLQFILMQPENKFKPCQFSLKTNSIASWIDKIEYLIMRMFIKSPVQLLPEPAENQMQFMVMLIQKQIRFTPVQITGQSRLAGISEKIQPTSLKGQSRPSYMSEKIRPAHSTGQFRLEGISAKIRPAHITGQPSFISIPYLNKFNQH